MPETLDEFPVWPDDPEGQVTHDGWKRPLIYERGPGAPGDPRDRVKLTSLGADGLPGGSGDDADIRWPEDFEFMRRSIHR